MNLRAKALVAVVVCGVAACGDTGPRDQFASEVAPLLEGHCLATACHGVAADAEQRGEVIDWTYFHVRVRDDLRIADMDQAYDTAKERINTVEHRALSSLVRKPLAPAAGGLVHRGGAQFDDLDDAELAVIMRWIERESEGGEGATRDTLPATTRQFADEVLPHLASGQCMSQACHGPTAPFTGFAQPMVLDGVAVFSTADVVKNHKAARMHLFLGGDPMQSRLIRKVVPVERGGIVHRGGNDIFFGASGGAVRDDPVIAAMVRWAAAERSLVLAAEPPVPAGVVYVRGPARAQAPFASDGFVPGSDLYVLASLDGTGTPRNLTAAAHQGPADVRDPAVRHDGARIAFAMRLSPDDALNIYEIGVDGTGLVQLTNDALRLPGGGFAANAQPTYGPDGRVYFVSTRAGQLATGYDQLDTDVWAVDPSSGSLERMTHEPSPVATPSFIGVGKSYGTLGFTMRRTIGGRYEAPTFRVPLDHNKAYHGDPELHIHHGVTIAEDILYAMRTMPDGRFAAVLMSRDNLWRGGRLAVFDRQIGPEIPAGFEHEAGMGGFRHAFSSLDDAVSPGGVSAGGFYRHPVPLPDGRIMVTRATDSVDLGDPGATPEMGIYIITLDEAGARDDGTTLASIDVLIDEPGIAEYDAEIIVARPLEDDPNHAPAWTPGGGTATLAFRHVNVLGALFANLEARGVKSLRDDLVYARLIASVPTTPNELNAPVGDSPHGRVAILAEVPLAGNSLHVEVPANTPFRVQFLNADRMAVGAQHNRWIDAAPGETFPGGVSPTLYPTLCAGCHGSLSGAPGDVGGPTPDAITSASVTLATHDNLNPRLPLPPVPVDAEPRVVDFVTDLAPVVASTCAVTGCHAPGTPAGGLDLTQTPTARFDAAYEALLQTGTGSTGGRAYVDADGASAYGSYLVERMFGRELGASRALSGACGATRLTDDQRLMFVRWIDTGAPYRSRVQ